MKLVSTSSELMALRNICGNDVVVSGTLLSGVDETYFHNEFTKEAYALITDLNRQSGQLPRWSSLVENPALSEKARSKLKKAHTERYRSSIEATRALEVLNEYRQLRGAYALAENIVSGLRKDKVNVGKLLSNISNEASKLQQNKAVNNDVLVFGKGNNSTQFVRDMMDAETLDYLPTGFSAFDDENGGIGFGNLFVLGGSTGGGKCVTRNTNLTLVKLVKVTHDDGTLEELTPHEYRSKYLGQERD